jgi:branched-chain amino acid transport system permease protein
MALAACLLSFGVTVWISRVRFGYALKSIRNDEEVAEVSGLRTQPVKLAALALSATFAGLAGAIQAWQLSYIDPSSVFGLHVALVPIAMALLGGSGLRWGPLVGVVVLACIQQWLLVSITMLQATIYGLIILLIGRFMPGGLLRANWLAGRRWFGASDGKPPAAQRSRDAAGAAAAPLPLPVRRISPDKALLECRDVRMEFGGNVALAGISLRISEGEVVGLIGPNGSGKTTLFNCISKVHEPTGGAIRFLGQDLRPLRRDQVARLGVGRTYQNPRPFGDLTVRENISIPLLINEPRLSPREALSQADAFLEYAELIDRRDARADALSLQEKKALEFARALACKPRLLLVDEVASGLTPAEVSRFVGHIRHVRDRYGITVIWVEHIFSALAQVVDRVVVLEQGSLIANGSLREVVKDERVLRTYLGSAAAGVV